MHELVVIAAQDQLETSVRPSTTTGRLVALDGLRGVAAMVVVFHHIYQIARPFLEPTTHAWAPGSLWWFISATPIKLLSAGSESVLVFFVLSGVVVPLPLLARGARGWFGFLCGRLLRLYVPVWGGILLSGILLALVPRPASVVTNGSWVERTNATSAKPGLLFSEAGLMRNSFSTDSVLWSLRWEIIFSVALPLFLVLAILLRRFWIPLIVVCAGLTLVGKVTNIDALLYLPVFFAGTLISVNLDSIREWAIGPSRIATALRIRSVALGAVAVSALLIVTSWMFRPIVPAGTFASDAIGSLTPLGAVGVVLCAIILSPVRGPLSMRVPQWLGRVSFSLYLTHLPILVALVYVFGDRNCGLVALVGIPISLGFAYLFFRFVEAPSHRLAHRVTRVATRLSTTAVVAVRARHVARLRTS